MGNSKIQIFEVGPRDGLQNEPHRLSLKNKIWFVENLVKAGIQDIELGAFVRPDRVPQMADTDQIYRLIQNKKIHLKGARPWCLIPNRIGLRRALTVGVSKIAVFTAATDTFAERNIGMNIKASLEEFRLLIQEARQEVGSTLSVRGYVSTAFGCPFEGKVKASKALKVIEKLAELDVDQISIGDTIGIAHPKSVEEVIKPALRVLGKKKTAIHLHDTRGTALANALRAIDLGVEIIDSSAGGLGGCPFAPGASGNLSTEDLVFMLNGMGIKTGINLDYLCKISLQLAQKMNRPLTSRYLQSYSVE